jgi:hypothetical protein
MWNTQEIFINSNNPNIRFKNIQQYEHIKTHNTYIQEILYKINKPSIHDDKLLLNSNINSDWEVLFIPFNTNEVYACLVANKNIHNKDEIENYVHNFLKLKLNIKPTEYISGDKYEMCKNYIDTLFPFLFKIKDMLFILII